MVDRAELPQRAVKVSTFAKQVWDIEGVRIVIRTNPNERAHPYEFDRALKGTATLRKLLQSRIEPCLDGQVIELVGGDGEKPRRNTSLKEVRRSYL